MNAFEELELTFTTSARDVFATYGKSAQYTGPQSSAISWSEEFVVAAIGFATDGARGSLTLVTQPGVLRRAHPLRSLTDPALCDVLGEAANMLIGRVKNQLLPRGVTLLLGLPATMLGRVLRLMPSDIQARSSWHGLDIDGGHLQFRIDIVLDECFALSPEVLADQLAVGTDGDVLFF